MKRFIYSGLFFISCLASVFAQQNRTFDTAFSVVTLSPPQSFYLDSRIVSQINGRSRVTIPVKLPQGTVRWFYSFAAMESKNEPMEWVGLAAQLTKLVDETGISAAFITRVVKPTGTATCDIYALDTEGGKLFEAKEDDKWAFDKFDKNASRQNMTGGIVESNNLKSNFLLGLSNSSLKTGINVRVEISAVVAQLTPIYNTSRKKTDASSESLWSGAQRETLFQRVQSWFDGKLTPSVTMVSTCVLSKMMKNFTPQEFDMKAKAEQDVLILWMKDDCFSETNNEALEIRMNELIAMKLKINELELSGDFTAMSSLAERMTLEFPSYQNQKTHMRSLLLSNQLNKAQTLAESLVQKNKDDLTVQANLGHIYLFSNQYRDAEKQYLKFQKWETTEGVSWEKIVATDFDFFIKNKIYNSNYENIKRKLKIK
jgi:hypothetical protein